MSWRSQHRHCEWNWLWQMLGGSNWNIYEGWQLCRQSGYLQRLNSCVFGMGGDFWCLCSCLLAKNMSSATIQIMYLQCSQFSLLPLNFSILLLQCSLLPFNFSILLLQYSQFSLLPFNFSILLLQYSQFSLLPFNFSILLLQGSLLLLNFSILLLQLSLCLCLL